MQVQEALENLSNMISRADSPIEHTMENASNKLKNVIPEVKDAFADALFSNAVVASSESSHEEQKTIYSTKSLSIQEINKLTMLGHNASKI
jgi:hypothetical protein